MHWVLVDNTRLQFAHLLNSEVPRQLISICVLTHITNFHIVPNFVIDVHCPFVWCHRALGYCCSVIVWVVKCLGFTVWLAILTGLCHGGAITGDSAICIELNVDTPVFTIFLNTSGDAFINALLEGETRMLSHIIMIFKSSVFIAIIPASYLQAQIIRDAIVIHDLAC